jgi:L-lactate dehydrogenase complex protein LldG
MKLVVRSAQPVFKRVAVDAALVEAGVRVVTMARSEGTGTPEGRLMALEADLGITGAEYAIAETGTVALLPGSGLSRLTSLTPPVHLAIVEASTIVETLEELLALRKLAVLRGEDLGSSMNLISGPSRSGDIEQTITIGVHGPKKVHLVVLEEMGGER